MHPVTQRRKEVLRRNGPKCHKCGQEKLLLVVHKEGVASEPLMNSRKTFEREIENLVGMCRRCTELLFMKIRGQKPSVHGEYSYYTNKGCRCTLCKESAHTTSLKYRSRYSLVNSNLANIFYEAGKTHKEKCTCGNDQVCEEWFQSSGSINRIKVALRT